VRTPPLSAPRRLLGRHLPARWVAGPRVDDALRVARETAAAGLLVGLEHQAVDPGDDEAELEALVGRVRAVGLAPVCELAVPVGRLGRDGAARLGATARDAGLAVVLEGRADGVAALAGLLPTAGVAVPAADAGAEDRCRLFAGRRVRLVDGRGAAAHLGFVRCLNVLMSGPGTPGVATTDPRLIAIAGERAAWNDRAPDNWEYVMPYGVRPDEQQRLVAAGYRVRVTVPSGAGALGLVARRLAGRS
jgi:proline dehydrogenase